MSLGAAALDSPPARRAHAERARLPIRHRQRRRVHPSQHEPPSLAGGEYCPDLEAVLRRRAPDAAGPSREFERGQNARPDESSSDGSARGGGADEGSERGGPSQPQEAPIVRAQVRMPPPTPPRLELTQIELSSTRSLLALKLIELTARGVNALQRFTLSD